MHSQSDEINTNKVRENVVGVFDVFADAAKVSPNVKASILPFHPASFGGCAGDLIIHAKNSGDYSDWLGTKRAEPYFSALKVSTIEMKVNFRTI